MHHLEAHCLMARLSGSIIAALPIKDRAISNISDIAISSPEPEPEHIIDPYLRHFSPMARYPFLAFLASGGHTVGSMSTKLCVQFNLMNYFYRFSKYFGCILL